MQLLKGLENVVALNFFFVLGDSFVYSFVSKRLKVRSTPTLRHLANKAN